MKIDTIQVLSLEVMAEELSRLKLIDVMRSTGLHRLTLQTIVDGRVRNPSYNNILKISKYLIDRHAEKSEMDEVMQVARELVAKRKLAEG